MPELPEVETTRRGIARHIEGRTIVDLVVRNPALREPVRADLPGILRGHRVLGVRRRAKYLVLDFAHGLLIIHLGMSGSLRLAARGERPMPHDHLEIDFGDQLLRYRDPRRFGRVIWQDHTCSAQSVLDGLGIEPLEPAFDGKWLHRATRGRRTPIKNFLMDAHRVAGIGNIYAAEGLFLAGIDPRTPACALGPRRCERLALCIRDTLAAAIDAGGSTLRDFIGSDGRPGYFQHSHAVYGRHGEPCSHCGTPIRRIVMAQRSTYYCPRCQRR